MKNKSPPGRFLVRALRPWWRLTRGLTVGAQSVVIDARSRVLLVRHGYRPGWFFPGGGVERGESIRTALARELEEETCVTLNAPAVLHGIFSNGEKFPGDHIVVFIVRDWEQRETPSPNMEIAEQGFFALKNLPRGTDAGTRRRLAEIFDGAELGDMW